MLLYFDDGLVFTNFNYKALHEYSCIQKEHCRGTFLVVQWLRIRLPMQGTQVRSLVREDPTCCRATKPQLLSLRSRAREPQLLSLHAATTEARMRRAHAPQQEKPPQ